MLQFFSGFVPESTKFVPKWNKILENSVLLSKLEGKMGKKHGNVGALQGGHTNCMLDA